MYCLSTMTRMNNAAYLKAKRLAGPVAAPTAATDHRTQSWLEVLASIVATPGVDTTRLVMGNGEVRSLKNLGWLYAHRHEIESFNMIDAWNEDWPINEPRPYVLTANLTEGRVFASKFASPSVCLDWVTRYVWQGLPLRWFNTDTKVGRHEADKLRGAE